MLVFCLQIQKERVKCLGRLKELTQGAIASTDESLKASLAVRTAKANVGFFLRQFHQARSAYEDADVRM